MTALLLNATLSVNAFSCHIRSQHRALQMQAVEAASLTVVAAMAINAAAHQLGSIAQRREQCVRPAIAWAQPWWHERTADGVAEEKEPVVFLRLDHDVWRAARTVGAAAGEGRAPLEECGVVSELEA